MKVDLNKPLFAKLKFVHGYRCAMCAFASFCKGHKEKEFNCLGGHWETDEVLPQSGTAFDMQQIQDSISSVDSKIKQFKSEVQQIKEEVKEEPKYFY